MSLLLDVIATVAWGESIRPVHGELVTDPREMEAIALRVEFYGQPWWLRIGREPSVPPEDVRAALLPCKIDMPSRAPSPNQHAGEAA